MERFGTLLNSLSERRPNLYLAQGPAVHEVSQLLFRAFYWLPIFARRTELHPSTTSALRTRQKKSGYKIKKA